MISKINPNRSFAVLANYTNNKKKDARIIAHKGVCIVNNQAIIDSFEAQASTNKRVENACKHISLSFSPHDAERITDDFMAQVATEYLEQMRIKNTQFIIVRHNDKAHPHCHIVYNRVDNDGKSISDSNDYRRSVKIARELTIKYGLHIARRGQDNGVNRNRLKGKAKTYYRIKDNIRDARSISKTWEDFNKELHKRNLSMSIYYHRSKQRIQGASYTEGSRHLVGSLLNASYPQLCTTFGDIFQSLVEDVGIEAMNTAFALTEGTEEIVRISLNAIIEFALQPHIQATSVNYGGGGGNNPNNDDDDKKRKNNKKVHFIYKFRR